MTVVLFGRLVDLSLTGRMQVHCDGRTADVTAVFVDAAGNTRLQTAPDCGLVPRTLLRKDG